MPCWTRFYNTELSLDLRSFLVMLERLIMSAYISGRNASVILYMILLLCAIFWGAHFTVSYFSTFWLYDKFRVLFVPFLIWVHRDEYFQLETLSMRQLTSFLCLLFGISALHYQFLGLMCQFPQKKVIFFEDFFSCQGIILQYCLWMPDWTRNVGDHRASHGMMKYLQMAILWHLDPDFCYWVY